GEVASYLGRSARKQPPLAIARFHRQALAMPCDTVRKADARGITSGIAGDLVQPGETRTVAGQAVERVRRVGADRIPRVAEADGAAQCRSALAAHPDWRVWLLHRFWREDDAGELDMLALEVRIVLGPERSERLQV